jgi:sirohydrochlorin cobaltochelatase
VSNPYRIHAFVCTGGKVCPSQGSEAIWLALKTRVRELGLQDEIRISKSGCVGQCGHGPMACVYPEGVWYRALSADDVEPLLDHLRGGKVHEARLYHPARPGGNKVDAT